MKCVFVPEFLQGLKAGEDHFPSLSPNKPKQTNQTNKTKKKREKMPFSFDCIFLIATMTFWPCTGPVLCKIAIFNATATCCFSLRRKIQGWSGTRTPVEPIRAQAHLSWKDLVGSVPHMSSRDVL